MKKIVLVVLLTSSVLFGTHNETITTEQNTQIEETSSTTESGKLSLFFFDRMDLKREFSDLRIAIGYYRSLAEYLGLISFASLMFKFYKNESLKFPITALTISALSAISLKILLVSLQVRFLKQKMELEQQFDVVEKSLK